MRAWILGFLSIYIVWAIPALPPFINWGGWSSFAYVYGDHIVLPLFNAVSFWLLAKNTARIPLWTIPAVFVLGVLLVAFFDPDISVFFKAGSVDSVPKAYHSGFVVLEFSFILFMCAVYPRLRGAYAPLWALGALTLLTEAFLGFVHIADARLNDLTLFTKISSVMLLGANFIVLVLQRKFDIFGKVKRMLQGQR